MATSNIFKEALERELLPALGCTEPMAYALLAALARQHAPGKIKKMSFECDGLNAVGVQAVGIPNTKGKHGAYLSAALGILAGRPDLGMLVLDKVTDEDVKAAEELVAQDLFSLELVQDASSDILFMKCTLETDEHTAVIIMEGVHDPSGIRYIEADGEVLLNNLIAEKQTKTEPYREMDYSVFTLENIYDYCKSCDLSELDRVVDAIEVNRKIAVDGLENPLGLQVARTLREKVEKGLVPAGEIPHIIMWTVSGVDARMGGSSYPAMINTGSGNQGIIVTMAPVAAAEYCGNSEEEKIRAAAFSNLVNIWIDYRSYDYAYMSPQCYCATAACAAAACGVAFLHGATKEQIDSIICTTMGMMPGIICDGAKPTCALRTMAGLSGALETMLLAEKGIRASIYEGVVSHTAGETMDNLYRLQKECMDKKMDAFVWKIKKEQNRIH